MRHPTLTIDLTRLEDNARAEVALFGRHGVTVMGVNKVFNGLSETAAAVVRGGIEVIAESRLDNLEKIAGVAAAKCLLRSPGPSEAEQAVRLADISLNTELETIRALSRAAARAGRKHSVLFMIDMGDLREGLWFEDYDAIHASLAETLRLPGVSLYGLGTNFNCFGAIKPTRENGLAFVALARRLERDLECRFPFLSGGNCTSTHLLRKGQWPEGVNHLRIGGLHQFGIDYVDFEYVPGFHHSKREVRDVSSDLYLLRAEIIEISRKPTAPVGEPDLDAFLRRQTFIDRGRRLRAILALGRQDVPAENVRPTDERISVLGQSSDHTIVDIEECPDAYRLGDTMSFELDYTGLLHASSSRAVRKMFTGGPP